MSLAPLARLAALFPRGLVAALILVLAWEAAVWIFAVKDYLLPAPSAIVVEFVRRWPRILDGAKATTLQIVLGFAIATLVSIPLAMGIAFSAWMERNIYPLIVAFQVIPKIALAPVFVIWLGIGLVSKLLMVFLLCFFPMLVNNVAGFRGVNPEIMATNLSLRR